MIPLIFSKNEYNSHLNPFMIPLQFTFSNIYLQCFLLYTVPYSSTNLLSFSSMSTSVQNHNRDGISNHYVVANSNRVGISITISTPLPNVFAILNLTSMYHRQQNKWYPPEVFTCPYRNYTQF